MKSTNTSRRKTLLPILLIVLATAGLWFSGRLTYLTVSISDDKAGDTQKTLVGAVWDPAVVPLALAMLASLIVMLAVGSTVRRLLGVLIALLAATASFRSVQLLTSEVDLARARDILVAGIGTQKQSSPVHVTGWADVTSAQVHTGPVSLAIIAAACALVGGIVLALNPGGAARRTRYETPSARREGIEEELRDNPDSARVLWDALDSGVDPTEEVEPMKKAEPAKATDSAKTKDAD